MPAAWPAGRLAAGDFLAAGDLQSPATEYQDLQSEKTIPMRWP